MIPVTVLGMLAKGESQTVLAQVLQNRVLEGLRVACAHHRSPEPHAVAPRSAQLSSHTARTIPQHHNVRIPVKVIGHSFRW